MDYKASGVDIDAGNETVRRIRTLAQSTFTPGVLSDIGSFGGLFRIEPGRFREPVLVSSADGVGTKLKVAFLRQSSRHGRCGSGQPLRQRHPGAGCRAAVLPRLPGHRTARAVGGRGDHSRDGSGLPRERLRAARRRDRRDAGLLRRWRVRPRRLHRRRRRARAPDQPASRLRQATCCRCAFVGPAHQRLLAGADASCSTDCSSTIDSFVPELGQTVGDALLEPPSLLSAVVAPLLDLGHIKGMAHITGGGITDNLPRVLPQGTGAASTPRRGTCRRCSAGCRKAVACRSTTCCARSTWASASCSSLRAGTPMRFSMTSPAAEPATRASLARSCRAIGRFPTVEACPTPQPPARRARLGPRQQPAGAHRRHHATGGSTRRSRSSSPIVQDAVALERARAAGIEALCLSHRDGRHARTTTGRSLWSCRRATSGWSAWPASCGSSAVRCSTPSRTRSSTSTRRCCRRFPASMRSGRRSTHGVKVSGVTVHLVDRAARRRSDRPAADRAGARRRHGRDAGGADSRRGARVYPDAVALVLDGGWTIDGRSFRRR